MTIVSKGCLDWILEMFDRYLPEEGSAEDEGEDGESIAINTAGGLEKILGGAGFEGIRVVQEETDFVYADEEAWWSVLRTMGVRGAIGTLATNTSKNLGD